MSGKLWVFKLDARGGILWQRDYGTVGIVGAANSVRLTADGDYIVAGGAVLKLDAAGNVLWQKAFGGADGGSYAGSVQPTPDGGYVVAGTTGAAGWVARLDASGSIIRQKISTTSAGPRDGFRSVQLAADGGYIVAGCHALSIGTFVVSDVWVLKLDRGGNVVWQRTYGYGDAYAVQPTPDGGGIECCRRRHHGCHHRRHSRQFGHQLHIGK